MIDGGTYPVSLDTGQSYVSNSHYLLALHCRVGRSSPCPTSLLGADLCSMPCVAMVHAKSLRSRLWPSPRRFQRAEQGLGYGSPLSVSIIRKIHQLSDI